MFQYIHAESGVDLYDSAMLKWQLAWGNKVQNAGHECKFTWAHA